MLNKEEIKNIIPQREPFLMIDKVEEFIPGESCTAYKFVNEEEWYFKGHFPGNPIMPGVLQLEAMAQMAAGTLAPLPQYKGKLFVYAGIDGVRFRKQVIPGDRLDIETEITKIKGPIIKIHAKASVDGVVATEADLMFSAIDE